MFVFPPVQQPFGHSKQIQRLDMKFNGHVWYKVKMTNIKNNFEFGFRSPQCLGHLRCRNNTWVQIL
jgi:hypothetical protein